MVRFLEKRKFRYLAACRIDSGRPELFGFLTRKNRDEFVKDVREHGGEVITTEITK
jgi:hypothetical protein